MPKKKQLEIKKTELQVAKLFHNYGRTQCSSFVCAQHEREHVTESTWRIPLNAQCTGADAGGMWGTHPSHQSILTLFLMNTIFLHV